MFSYYKYIGSSLTNVTAGGEKGAIYERTPKIREKMSKSSFGRKHTEKTKEKISKTLTGIKRNHSKEHREKISKTLTGRKGKIVSFETRQKLSKAKLGQKHTEQNKISIVENNKSYKLNKNNLYEIQELYESGNFTQAEIGKMFNIAASHVSRIIHNKTGKYLK